MALSAKMSRARRSAQVINGGNEILDFLMQEKQRKLLIAAAETGIPPVASVSGLLLEKGADLKIDIAALSIRQFIGTCVRAILEDSGYAVAERGVRIPKDPLFTTGSLYRKKGAEEPAAANVLGRMFAALNEEEAGFVVRMLRRRFPGL